MCGYVRSVFDDCRILMSKLLFFNFRQSNKQVATIDDFEITCAGVCLFHFDVGELVGRHVIVREISRCQQIFMILRNLVGQSRRLKTQKPAELAGFWSCLDYAKLISGAQERT